MTDQVFSTATGPLSEVALREQLRQLRTLIPDQPNLNPIVNVAFDISRGLESGSVSMSELRTLAGRLMDRACNQRAERLRQRIGYINQETTLQDFTSGIKATIDNTVDLDVAFARFKNQWERARSGIVLTAHPTFGISQHLSQHIVARASRQAADEGLDTFSDQAPALSHRPDDAIDLAYEHARAQDAIVNLRNGSAELINVFFATAAAYFGDRAYGIKPALTSLATWVGYDLDGRTDITWHRSYLIRLEEKRAGLTDIRERFFVLKHRFGDAANVLRITRQITGKLDLAIAAVDEQLRALSTLGLDTASLPRIANVLGRADTYNIVSTEPLTSLFDELRVAVETPQDKRATASLASLVATTGLGTAHIHLRINAQQLNNAFRAYVHEPWTADLSEAQALARIVDMIATVPHETVNFGSLELETATAIRQFALCAQIQKHVDAQAPIRFLIAECESPATVLIAVFFAKLFGVEKIVDISPLFETPAGLEGGARLMERLLEEVAYRDYVTGRGRLSLQTGFSDAGRFIGQISATLAIERLQHAMPILMTKAGVESAEFLMFSTHGESIGRGAHPGDLSTRLHYVFSDEARHRFAQANIAVKHETSFQGGDGFMFFGNRQLTTRAMATIVLDAHRKPVAGDPFYDDQNLSLDFLLRLRSYQQALFSHDGYRAVLGAYGPALLYRTGSRAIKRQSDGASLHTRGDPSRMRAIPNNAILQQFGYIANVVAGLGTAVGTDKERFKALALRSPRLTTLLDMIAAGKRLSSLNAMGANSVVFDAGFWAQRASWGKEQPLQAAFRALARYFLNDDRAISINKLVHHLRLDSIDLHAIMTETGYGNINQLDEARLELDVLQAIRLALIMRVFILAAQLPRFAPQNETDHETMLTRALGLDVPEVVAFMRAAFPHKASSVGIDGYDERATYRPRGIDDYGRLETEILEPMESAYEFIREVGTGISHHFGAFG